MQQLSSVTEQMAATTHSMVLKTTDMTLDVAEMSDHIADFDDFLRPIRIYFYWEPQCYDIPVCATMRSVFDTLDGIDLLAANRPVLSSFTTGFVTASNGVTIEVTRNP